MEMFSKKGILVDITNADLAEIEKLIKITDGIGKSIKIRSLLFLTTNLLKPANILKN